MCRLVVGIAIVALAIVGCNLTGTDAGSTDTTGGYTMTATLDDGTGTMSTTGSSSVTVTTTNGLPLYMVSIQGIELNGSKRQIYLTLYVNEDPTGKTYSLNQMDANGGSATYGRATGTTVGTPYNSRSGTLSFTSCAAGTNTAVGTFSFTAVAAAADSATVTITNGTFGN